ncbi:DUF6603 domain-containing protein [Kitasatospora purpeofusca]|uniref:DUF6603 domain-containing protein n=1 Tax=Kitasatospora purpeofusca TaxID=67352 RepID=UPI0036D3DBE7
MTLTVQELKEKIRTSTERFVLRGAEWGLPQAEELFTGHLPDGTLTVESPSLEVDLLKVSGEALLFDAHARVDQGPFPVVVEFQSDPDGNLIIGVRIDVALADWKIPVGHIDACPDDLQRIGDILHLVLGVVPARDGSPVCATGLGLTLKGLATKAGGKPYVWGMQSPVGRLWTLQGAFDPIVLSSLDDLSGLGAWAGKKQGDFTLPTDIQSDSMQFTEAAVELSHPAGSGASHLLSVTARIDLGTGASWDIVPDTLKMSGLWAAFRILPAPSPLETTVGGTLLLGDDMPIAVQVVIPQLLIQGHLGRKVPLQSLVKKYLTDSGLPGLDTLSMTDLLVEASAKTPYWIELLAVVEGSLTAGPATLRNLRLQIKTGAGVETTAELGATWTLLSGGTVEMHARREESGWSFTGQAVHVRPGDLFHEFGADAPPLLKDLTLDRLGVAFSMDSSQGKKVLLEAQTSMLLGQVDAQLTVTATMTQQSGGRYKREFAGQLVLQVPQDTSEPRQLTFGLSGDVEKGEFTASCTDTHGVTLSELVTLIGVDKTSGVSEWLNGAATIKAIDLGYSTSARSLVFHIAGADHAPSLTLVSVSPKEGERLWVLRAGISVDVGLAQVPLLEGAIPKDRDLRLMGLSVLYAPRAYKAAELKQLNTALDAVSKVIVGSGKTGLPRLPDDQLAKGTAFGVDVLLPGTNTPLSVAVRPATSGKDKQALPEGDGTTEAEPEAWALAPAAGDGAGMSGPLVAWVDVHKALGPLRLERVGVSFADNTVWVLFEAALGMAGLTLGVQGLGIGVPIKEPDKITPRLDGLSLAYDRPPLLIAGALVNRPADEKYALLIQGAVVVSVKSFGLTALGAYARPKGSNEPAMFVFGKATGQFGGPPPVKLTALMAGFGYNTSVRVPEADKVLDFPFLKGMTGTDPLKVLETLMGGTDAWVRPTVGQLWFAAGLGFQLFEFIDCQALLMLEVGDDFAVSLLGTADAAFPKGAGLTKYARAVLGMSVAYRGSEQILKATAQLAPGSFVIDEQCVLTGGFAFYLWFDDAHHGDFVVTLGGYHPRYEENLPAHYPKVPRLGFNWPILPGLTMSGRAYFALTPGAIMAGGRLEVHYRSGDLHAWLVADAHMLIEFAPFSFEAGFEISIGVSFVLDLWLVRETIRVEVGATLELWGPPTAGYVTVHLWFIDFTIDFGDKRKISDRAATWEEVLNQLPPREQAVKLSITDGLLPAPASPGTDDGQPAWVVAPGAFSFTVRTVVPSTRVNLTKEEGGPYEVDGAKEVNIRLRRKDGEGLQSVLTLTLTRTVQGQKVVQDLADWRPSNDKVVGDLPAALWGRYQGDLSPYSDRQVPDQLTGINLRLPLPHEGTSPGKVLAGTLAFDDRFPDGPLPLKAPLHGTTTATSSSMAQARPGDTARQTTESDLPDGAATPDASAAGQAAAQEEVTEAGAGVAVTAGQEDPVKWARRRLFEAMAYLGVSPGFNEDLDPLDPLVFGDDTVERDHRDLDTEPAQPGPRLYAMSLKGSVTPIDMESLALSASFQLGESALEWAYLAVDPEGSRICSLSVGGASGQRFEVADIANNPPDGADPWNLHEDVWVNSQSRGSAMAPGGEIHVLRLRAVEATDRDHAG